VKTKGKRDKTPASEGGGGGVPGDGSGEGAQVLGC